VFSNSILGEILKLLPRDVVARHVREHGSDRWCKRFRSWDHLVALATAQLSGASSLRELEVVFNGQSRHQYHLNAHPVRRSTLSDASRSRTPLVFRGIAMAMIARGGRRQRLAKEILTILDSSTITISGRGSDWASGSRSRAHNQGLKLHVQYDHGSGDLGYVEVTDANVNDITQALDIPLVANHIYIFDKGYCDYNWWQAIAEQGSFFVTRLKRNAAFAIIEERGICPEDDGFILEDQLIRLTNKNPGGGRRNHLAGIPLRLIRIKHPAGKTRPFWIVSNALEATAAQIAGWYKARWSIELLFKWLKQNLLLKTFMGESRNAVMIQLFVAMITYILAKLYHELTQGSLGKRLKDTLMAVRGNLFARPETVRRRRATEAITKQNQPELWGMT